MQDTNHITKAKRSDRLEDEPDYVSYVGSSRVDESGLSSQTGKVSGEKPVENQCKTQITSQKRSGLTDSRTSLTTSFVRRLVPSR